MSDLPRNIHKSNQVILTFTCQQCSKTCVSIEALWSHKKNSHNSLDPKCEPFSLNYVERDLENYSATTSQFHCSPKYQPSASLDNSSGKDQAKTISKCKKKLEELTKLFEKMK